MTAAPRSASTLLLSQTRTAGDEAILQNEPRGSNSQSVVSPRWLVVRGVFLKHLRARTVVFAESLHDPARDTAHDSCLAIRKSATLAKLVRRKCCETRFSADWHQACCRKRRRRARKARTCCSTLRGRARDDSFFSSSGYSEGTAETRQGLLRSSDSTRDTRNDNRNRGTVHTAGRWHEHFAGEITHHQLQALDANGTSAVVGRSPIGIREMTALTVD